MKKKSDKKQNNIEAFFNNIFSINKTEKQKVLSLIEKQEVNSFLFYTDYRNIPNILKYGIRQIKNIDLKGEEVYYVWSYLQHEESVDLELDNSSRAYFWKWASDSKMNPANMCVIAIDPYKLSKQTVDDWVFDTSLNVVSIRETIPSESIKWIMVRRDEFIPKMQKLSNSLDLEIEFYYGNNSEIKSRNKMENE